MVRLRILYRKGGGKLRIKLQIRVMILIGGIMLISGPTTFGQGAWITIGGQTKIAAKKSYEKGRFRAKRDLRRGKYIIKTYGLIDGSGFEYYYNRILHEEYGVEVDRVAGCIVMPSLANEVAGYNSIMVAEVEKKYGKGVLSGAVKRTLEANKISQEPIKPITPTIQLPKLMMPIQPNDDLPTPPPPKSGND